MAFIKILFILKKIKPQILHTHSSKAGVLGRVAGKILKIKKIIHTPHGHIFYGYFGKIKTFIFIFIERLLAKFTDTLIALTEMELEESIQKKIGDRKKWRVVHSGIKYIEIQRQKSPLVKVVSIARLEYVKGVDILIKAAHILKDKNYEFIVAGDGSLRKKYEEMIQKLGVKNFKLAGEKNPVDILKDATIYIQPSRNEAMGRAVIYAMLAKVPIIASNVCGLKSIIKDGFNGFLFEPENHIQLAEKINYVAENDVTNIIENAYRYVNETDETGFKRFSVESMVEKIKKIYAE